MAKTMAEIVAKSDAKRGVRAKTYKLPEETIALIEQLSREQDVPQYQIIQQAVELFKQAHS
ncbi:ribbon-helix-helix protein, CopG family [Avibacterium paragallinarum]|uniref:ribbon-helix-helix protein, CopG family n=2 Tax=Avibacterium paragallinarum TaxID=728 RepID=UPI00188EC3BB|nr:ribbon-helix-helix protein, CopG family [Avibacterium paragallinarum]QZP14761.1 ribbon-helix-helix protein, CopG family [Avibacterium paragallinarum]WAL56769.1 ribbon-helix-helix protein, CopG family [Avibacterium paragallinarum]WAM59309.1 ribbon-helix-helix protein, CopG family [Avibacterium paragallinarum]